MSIMRPNMLSFIFYFYLLIFSYFGTIIIATNDEYFNEQIRKIAFSNTKFYVWLAVSYTLIVIPIGINLCRMTFRINDVSSRFDSYTNSKIIGMISQKDSYLRYPLYILSIICLLVVAYVIYSIGFETFKKAFSVEGQVELMILRRDIDVGFSGNIYVRNILGSILLPILAYTSYCYYLMTKSKFDLLWFISMFVAAFLMLVHNFEKSPFIFFLFGFIFLYVLVKNRISKTFLISAVVSTLLLLIAIYAFITKNVGAENIEYMVSPFKEGLVGRVLISQITGLYSHFEAFPLQHDFIGTASLSKFLSASFLPDFTDRSGRIVLELYAPAWVEMGYGGSFNTLFIGEAWANYGIAGILIAPLWVGFLIGLCYYTFLSLKKTPVFLALFVYYSYKTSISGGLNDYLYNAKAVILFIIIALALYIGVMLKNAHVGKKQRLFKLNEKT